jgi:hypothetical protein
VSTSDSRHCARDSKLFIGRTNSCAKMPSTLITSRCLVPLFLIRTGALHYILVLSILKFNICYNLPVKLIFQELLKTAEYCGPCWTNNLKISQVSEKCVEGELRNSPLEEQSCRFTTRSLRCTNHPSGRELDNPSGQAILLDRALVHCDYLIKHLRVERIFLNLILHLI